MRKKQFKTESKKLLDMMINSVYTHKEIFLRELISNASDAIDKLYFRSLTDDSVNLSRTDYSIFININKEEKTLTISDNGCGMTENELENNLGTIAKSGSFDFKRDGDKPEDIDIIGQFGVGFYSAFMVADKIEVFTRPYGESTAYKWTSEGLDGYTVEECEKESFGTEIILHIKADTEEESYSDFLEEYRIRGLVKKYSDYIRYPIKMPVTGQEKIEGEDGYRSVTKTEVLNSMIPIWKRAQGEVSAEEYNAFYSERFYDYNAPAKVITQKSEGTATYTALLFIPKSAPYNYYTKEYEKGLELYSCGVMIMERCSDLLPDYFSFVRGLVDSSDLTLNISRETLQHDRQLKVMAKAIEKKIKSELEKMMRTEREEYESFFDAFGIQIKYGVYSDYGMHKDTLKDLLLFHSSVEGNKYVSLKEYVDAMKDDQKAIYYAAGESIEKIDILPQVTTVKAKGYEILYLTDDVDEFALRLIGTYSDKEFKNVTAEELDLLTDDEKEAEKTKNESTEDMLTFIKDAIGKVNSVKWSQSLTDHAVCLSSQGDLSIEMAKTLKKMPGAQTGIPDASIVLEINMNHPIANTLTQAYESDKKKLKRYAKLLYGEACLISGVPLDDTKEFTSLISELMI